MDSSLMDEEDVDYIKIFKAIAEIPFQVGRNLLVDFLIGNYKNKSVVKNKLDELCYFGSMNMKEEKINSEIDRLIANGMIELSTSDYSSYIKILKVTTKGRKEITHPTLNLKKLKNKSMFKFCEITDEDRIKFRELDSFLSKFNDSQKRAIISDAKNILCIAGAGSGKTTVLTKRVEFLVKYRGVSPDKILAIAFPRKARQELENRLNALFIRGVQVHTFNSFCEGILREHEFEIYGRPIRVQSYGDKILAMNLALANLGTDMEEIINSYFTSQQRRFKTGNQLANSFMNDCFSVIDYFKVTGEKEYDFSKIADAKEKHNAKKIYQITQFLKNHMNTQGLRDYTDQIIDAIKFLKKNSDKIPKFEYILVDEYQDVNSMQVELLKLLKPENVFAVGDPRQSIFGWRGSDIKFILNFEKDYGDAEAIHLIKNYRSSKNIVDFMNHSISDMGLPDLEAHKESKNSKIKILEFDSEEAERNFVVKKIIESPIPKDEIFVLARTNRQLTELSQVLKQRGIAHVVKIDEIRNPQEAHPGEVTLATIHAIKGLETRKVFLIGANEQNFPCKASDHPAIEMIKTEDYDKEEEERRLFYVAISRAKEFLFITYSGKRPTYFISDKMKSLTD